METLHTVATGDNLFDASRKLEGDRLVVRSTVL